MSKNIEQGNITSYVTNKNIENFHSSVFPPDSKITLLEPLNKRLEVTKIYAVTKLRYFKQQQEPNVQSLQFRRKYIEVEKYCFRGYLYLKNFVEQNENRSITVDLKRITPSIRPVSKSMKRTYVIYKWQKSLPHVFIPPDH